jgi:hypothetical protein
VYIKK